jgi:hypothetical protein
LGFEICKHAIITPSFNSYMNTISYTEDVVAPDQHLSTSHEKQTKSSARNRNHMTWNHDHVLLFIKLCGKI